jgi:hypothetical protein
MMRDTKGGNMGTLGQMKMLVADCERLVRRVETLIQQDVQDDLFTMMMKVPVKIVQEDLKTMRRA